MPRAEIASPGMTDTWGRRNRSLSDRSCPICGTDFRPLRASSRFCSRPCARKINGGHNRQAETWWTNSKGYIEGRIWRDGKQVQVKRHRFLMEAHLGRALMAGEDVHHIDGDKQNNDLNNLQVLSHREHSKISNAERTYRSGYRLVLSNAERKARSDRMKAMRRAKATAGETRNAEPIHRRDGDAEGGGVNHNAPEGQA